MIANPAGKSNVISFSTIRDKYDAVVRYITENQEACYKFAYFQVKDPQAAQDILQESMVKALQHSASLRNIESIKTWFYRILVNESMQYFRKQKRLVFTDQLPEPAHEGPTGVEENKTLDRLDLTKAIDGLEPNLKTVITLRYFEDMKISDIAQVTKTNENTVKTRIRRALDQLKLLY